MYGITLIVVLVVVGGVIAYVGDRIGMKVGRKRLTIFGLRPKYTSIIVTVITGVAVATATLTMLTIASKDVRNALFHMKEIQTALATTRESLSRTTGELKEKEAKALELSNTIQVLSTRVADKAKEYDILTARYANLQSELERVVGERNRAEKALGQVRSELSRVTDEYEDVSQRYLSARGNLEQTRQELSQATARISELQTAEKQLVAKIDSLEGERKELEAEVNVLQNRTKELIQGGSNLYSALVDMSLYLEGMSVKDVIFKANEIIACVVVQGGRPVEEIKADLIPMLTQANNLALGKGAKIDELGNAIYFFEDNLEKVYSELAQTKSKAVVRLVSATNATTGQPVFAYLEAFPNTLIFKNGEVIASRQMNGGADEGRIQDELLLLLADVNSEALKRGMVSDAYGKVGKIPGKQFMDTAKAVSSRKGTVTVDAVATQDTYSAVGPLKVVLEVR